jgi:hypothetical protein
MNAVDSETAKIIMSDLSAHAVCRTDYGFYYHLYLVDPKFHFIFNCILMLGRYPPFYYAFIAKFLISNKDNIVAKKFDFSEVVELWNIFLVHHIPESVEDASAKSAEVSFELTEERLGEHVLEK